MPTNKDIQNEKAQSDRYAKSYNRSEGNYRKSYSKRSAGDVPPSDGGDKKPNGNRNMGDGPKPSASIHINYLWLFVGLAILLAIAIYLGRNITLSHAMIPKEEEVAADICAVDEDDSLEDYEDEDTMLYDLIDDEKEETDVEEEKGDEEKAKAVDKKEKIEKKKEETAVDKKEKTPAPQASAPSAKADKQKPEPSPHKSTPTKPQKREKSTLELLEEKNHADVVKQAKLQKVLWKCQKYSTSVRELLLSTIFHSQLPLLIITTNLLQSQSKVTKNWL